jgi:hypothetical protein
LQKLDHSSKRLAYLGTYYSFTPNETALLLALAESRSKPSGDDPPSPKEQKVQNSGQEEKSRPPRNDPPAPKVEKAENHEKQEATNSKPEENKP